MSDLRTYHFYFEGRVQGVGFRFTARYLANKHNVKGWVMNLADGRVELLAQGKKDDLDNFLKDLQGEFKGYIANFNLEEMPSSQICQDFHIKFCF